MLMPSLKNLFTATSRLVFDQRTGHRGLVKLTCKTNCHRGERWFDFTLSLIVGYPRGTIGKVGPGSECRWQIWGLVHKSSHGRELAFVRGKKTQDIKKRCRLHLIRKRSQGGRLKLRILSISRGKCGPKVICFREKDKSPQKISRGLDALVVYWMSLKKNIFESLSVPGSLWEK